MTVLYKLSLFVVIGLTPSTGDAMPYSLLCRVELSENKMVQTVLLNYLIIIKLNQCIVELSVYIRHYCYQVLA